MRLILPALLIFCLQFSNLSAQSNCIECDKIEVVGIYDFFPTPQTPGGDQILLLLTLHEDLESFFNRFYVQISIISESGDTITSPTGPNQTLPASTTDTIPYLLQLHPDLGANNFPSDFNGKIILKMDNVPPCPQRTVCEIDFKRTTTGTFPPNENKREVNIFPNPTHSTLHVDAQKDINAIQVFDSEGKKILLDDSASTSTEISFAGYAAGAYLLRITFADGSRLNRWIQKY